MMEKYGTDFRTLPVTKEQMEQIQGLCKQGSLDVVPTNRKEAEELLARLLQDKPKEKP